MSKLCVYLPPLAPDYSGAASALFELGGMIIIHDASGCTGNYTGFDEPRWFGSNVQVFCSGLRHLDAILGNDEKLINNIAKAAKELKPRFIAILGSPVPMVIGTDFQGLANEVEYVTGIPTIGLTTRGLYYYGKGFYDAFKALMKKLKIEKQEKKANSINILGMTPLDFHIIGNEKDFRKLFEDDGIEVLSTYSMGLTIEDMRKSSAASLNVAVSQAGVQLAQYMKMKYKIPYIAVTPVGDGSIALNAVRKALKGEEYLPHLEAENAERKEGEPRILIVGEQIIADSIRTWLRENKGYNSVDVAVLCDFSQEHAARDDIKIENETHLIKVLNSGKYDTVVADPMVGKAIRKDEAERMKFFSLPHVAVSSKVHWDEYKNYISEEMTQWLDTIN